MSILAYVGLPGSGKSYGAVANQVLPALRAQRLVVTNLALKNELLLEHFPGCEVRTFATSELVERPELIDEVFPPGCVAVIDEAWRLWPAGWKVDKIPAPYKSFLAEHRHRVDSQGRSLQIVIVTQDLAQLAAFSRQLVEQTFVHTKLGNLGMRGSYKVSCYEGAVTGLTPPDSRRTITNLGKYSKDVFQYYQSHTMSESGTSGADEKPIDQRGTIWRRPMLWLGMLFCIGTLVFGGKWAIGFAQNPGKALGAGAVGAEASAVPSVPGRASGPTAGSFVAPSWRVTGHLRIDGGKSLVLISDGQRSGWYPFDSYCREERTGAIVCDINGKRITSATHPL